MKLKRPMGLAVSLLVCLIGIMAAIIPDSKFSPETADVIGLALFLAGFMGIGFSFERGD